MTKIYYPCIFGVHPWFLAHSSKNPWNLLSDESNKDVFCYANEVIWGPHLRMGTACQENRPYDYRTQTFCPTPQPLEFESIANVQ